MQRAANKLVILRPVSVYTFGSFIFNLQVHLPIAKRSLCEHVLGDSTNLGRGRHSDLPALFVLALSEKLVSVDENPNMASQVMLVTSSATGRDGVLVGKV